MTTVRATGFERDTVTRAVAMKGLPTGGGIAFRAASSATINGAGAGTLSIAMPVGVVDGDVMIAAIACRGATPTVATPAGWTRIFDQLRGASGMLSTFWKLAASETGPYVFLITGAGTAAQVGAINAYSGVNQKIPVGSVAGSQGSALSETCPAVRLGGTGFWVLRAACSGAAGDPTTTWATATEATDDVLAASCLSTANQGPIGPGDAGTCVATSTLSSSYATQSVGIQRA